MDFFAIEKVGSRYYLVKVVRGDDLILVSGVAYRTLAAAKVDADRMRLEIQSIGDMYAILEDYKRKTAPHLTMAD